MNREPEMNPEIVARLMVSPACLIGRALAREAAADEFDTDSEGYRRHMEIAADMRRQAKLGGASRA